MRLFLKDSYLPSYATLFALFILFNLMDVASTEWFLHFEKGVEANPFLADLQENYRDSWLWVAYIVPIVLIAAALHYSKLNKNELAQVSQYTLKDFARWTFIFFGTEIKKNFHWITQAKIILFCIVATTSVMRLFAAANNMFGGFIINSVHNIYHFAEWEHTLSEVFWATIVVTAPISYLIVIWLWIYYHRHIVASLADQNTAA